MKALSVVTLMLATLLAAVDVHAGSDIAISTPSPLNTPLAPSMETSFVLRIRNNGPDSIAGFFVEKYETTHVSYELSMQPAPGCGALLPWVNTTFPSTTTARFEVGPLAVGQVQVCTLTVRRPVSVVGDYGVRWVVDAPGDPLLSNNLVLFGFGALTDIEMQQRTLSFRIDQNGIAESLVQLVATNLGPTAVAPIILGQCPGSRPPAGFSIEGSYPGGCGDGNAPLGCISPMPETHIGYLIPTVAAGERYSCTLKLRSDAPYAGPLSTPLWIQSITNTDLTDLIDINRANNTLELTLGPMPSIPIPSMSMMGLTTLLIALFGVAGYRQTSVRQPVAAGEHL